MVARFQEVALLAVILAAAWGTGVGQDAPEGCACSNNAPDDQYTCEQQKGFDKCDADWMIDQKLCEYTCGRCLCDAAAAETPAATPAVPETAAATTETESATPAVTEDDAAAIAEGEGDLAAEKPAAAAKPKPVKKPAKKSKKPKAKTPAQGAVSAGAEPAVVDGDEGEDEAEEAALPVTGDEDEAEAEAEADAAGVVIGGDEEEEEEEEEAATEADAAEAGDDETATTGGDDAIALEDFADPKKTCVETVEGVLGQATDTELFYTILSATETSATLQTEKNEYTVFVPTNAAVESAMINLGITLDDLLSTYPEKATTIANYHVVAGVMKPADLEDPSLIKTLSTDPLVGGSQTEIEGLGSSAKIISDPIPVCKSVVYLVNAVLLPAADLAGIEPKNEGIVEAPTEEEVPSCKEGFDGFFAVSQDPELSILADTLNRYIMSEALADAEAEYTLFAPTDAAFEKMAASLGVTLEEFLDDADTIVGILDNHILTKVYEGRDLTAEPSAELISRNGSAIALETNAKGTLVDLFAAGSSAKVIAMDIDDSCVSAVHKVSGVLLPFNSGAGGSGVKGISVPQKSAVAPAAAKKPATKQPAASGECQVGSWSVFEVLNQISDLRVFTSILQQAKFTNIFTNKAIKVTIFAPVDYAFGNILQEGKGFFDLVPKQVLAENLISNHIVGRPLLAKNLKDGMKLNTALTNKGKPESLEIAEDPLSFPLGMTVSSEEATANVVRADIVACNSVIHVIDAVMVFDEAVIPSKKVSVSKALAASTPFASLLVSTPTPASTPTTRTG